MNWKLLILAVGFLILTSGCGKGHCISYCPKMADKCHEDTTCVSQVLTACAYACGEKE